MCVQCKLCLIKYHGYVESELDVPTPDSLCILLSLKNLVLNLHF